MEAKAIILLDGISSRNIIQVIKLKTQYGQGTGHVPFVGRIEMPTGSW